MEEQLLTTDADLKVMDKNLVLLEQRKEDELRSYEKKIEVVAETKKKKLLSLTYPKDDILSQLYQEQKSTESSLQKEALKQLDATYVDKIQEKERTFEKVDARYQSLLEKQHILTQQQKNLLAKTWDRSVSMENFTDVIEEAQVNGELEAVLYATEDVESVYAVYEGLEEKIPL